MNKSCAECKFLMQSLFCMCCGHKNADMSKDGNGRYTYPPANYQCDIDKFEKRDIEFNEQMAKTADEHGWKKIKEEPSVFGGTITYYDR